ncbi:hypothetical protein [Ruegeria sp. Ofav3-42]|uniref:hypothetical protein n=1 Tax=Ruegeria sp. Ofav3-42 TaxID=2917759 RepID=UPI001EF4B8C1|nr:hypothetical protein [Ruegeria sp. Ofav3-42]MCG7520879.1 hypothetical protein [Ruegeria sp. Ofav3-42]
MAELDIKHTVKTVRSPTEAGLYGFAEGLGKALGFAIVGLAVLWGLTVYLPDDDDTAQADPATEQR